MEGGERDKRGREEGGREGKETKREGERLSCRVFVLARWMLD